jgi:ribonuclease HII
VSSVRFGVDEAGKGPVLGSMFAAAVLASPGAIPDGVADSKTLSPDRRASLARTLREDDRIAVGVAEVSVERIDDPGTDMNSLTVAAQAEALAAVAEDGLSGTVDAGDTDAARFGRRVAEAVPFDVDVRAEHGADEAYPLVSAASVFAKVERDAHVAALADQHGAIGSGYPSDPTTREFLSGYVEEHGELPPFARESWRTSRDVLAAAEQSTLDAFEER